MDYANWIKQHRRFLARLPNLRRKVELSVAISPPLSMSAVQEIDRSLRLKLPPPLVKFLTTGAGVVATQYAWDPPDEYQKRLRSFVDMSYLVSEVKLCHAAALDIWQKNCLLERDKSWLKDEPELKAMWKRSVPFAFMAHGDFLALDVAQSAENPPVVYLDHEGAGGVISRSFDDFLRAWQRSCYLGPDLQLFAKFRDRRSGLLTGTTTTAEKLRALFADARLRGS